MNRITDRDVKVQNFRERFRPGRILDVRGDVLPRQHSNAGQMKRLKRQSLTKAWKDADAKARKLAREYEDASKAGTVPAGELALLLGEAQGAAETEQHAREALERFKRAQ